MSKFHINKHGVPAPCRAQKGRCPYGGNESHFDTIEAAQREADRINESQHGFIHQISSKPEVTLKDKITNTMSDYNVNYGLNESEGIVSQLEKQGVKIESKESKTYFNQLELMFKRAKASVELGHMSTTKFENFKNSIHAAVAQGINKTMENSSPNPSF